MSDGSYRLPTLDSSLCEDDDGADMDDLLLQAQRPVAGEEQPISRGVI